MTDVSFRLPGRALRALADGNFPTDHMVAWGIVRSAPTVRLGLGYVAEVTIDHEMALDIRDYLWSVADVLRSMTAEERGSEDVRPLEQAIERIESAVDEAGLL